MKRVGVVLCVTALTGEALSMSYPARTSATARTA